MERSHACTGSLTPWSPLEARESAPNGVAFRVLDRVGTPNWHFGAQWLAYMHPWSTLRCDLTERQRMTRGHRNSLCLSMYGSFIRFSMPVYPGAFVAVGTGVAARPPRRSQREELPHWAPALDSGVEASVWPGVQDAGAG